VGGYLPSARVPIPDISVGETFTQKDCFGGTLVQNLSMDQGSQPYCRASLEPDYSAREASICIREGIFQELTIL
jgi:hypothetical protein